MGSDSPSAALGSRKVEHIFPKLKEVRCSTANAKINGDPKNCLRRDIPVSEAYAALASGTLPEELAEEIFGTTKSTAAKQLTQRLRGIGNSFVAARTAMSNLMGDAQQLVKLTADRGSTEQQNRTAEFLANTIQPRRLGCFLSTFSDPALAPPELRAILSDPATGIATRWPVNRDAADAAYDRANAAVERAARVYPNQMTLSTRKIDQFMRDMSDNQIAQLSRC